MRNSLSTCQNPGCDEEGGICILDSCVIFFSSVIESKMLSS